MTELKPCPFCNGRAELKHYTIKGYEPDLMYYVECSKCGQTVVHGKFDTTYHSDKWAINKAIKVWNKRPNPWHKGVPQEEGWFLVKYRWTGGEGFPNKFTYRAVKNQRLRNGTILFTELEPSSEYWEPIEYQELDNQETTT